MEIILELHIVIRGKMEDWTKFEAIKDQIIKAVEWPGIEAEIGGGLFQEVADVQKEPAPM